MYCLVSSDYFLFLMLIKQFVKKNRLTNIIQHCIKQGTCAVPGGSAVGFKISTM